MEHPDAQPSSDKRILAVGEGPLTAAIVKELIRRGYNAHEATENEVAAAKMDDPLLSISRDLETIELYGHLVEPVVPLLARELEDHSPPPTTGICDSQVGEGDLHATEESFQTSVARSSSGCAGFSFSAFCIPPVPS